MLNMTSTSDANSTASTKQETAGQPVTKTCNRCEEVLPLGRFSKGIKHKDGYRTSCKACDRESGKRWVVNNPHKNALRNARQRSRKRGLAFNLTEAYLISIDRDVCPYLEIPIAFSLDFTGSGNAPINGKSLDRIRPELGYV